MTNTARALQGFFGGFGLNAYGANNVPKEAEAPYITYEIKEPEPLAKCILHAWVWYRDTSMTAISLKCDQIKAAIGTGLNIPVPGGFISLYRDNDTPFAQEQPDPDKTIRVMYLTMILHANTD